MFELAEQWRLPVVLFTEGGGGRPGRHGRRRRGRARLHGRSTLLRRSLSGLVPLVGHQLRPLLRRQRRAARLLRRGDRHRELEHRHGRPRDDRGRRARCLPARGGRPDGGPGARTAWSTSPSRTRPRPSTWRSRYLSYFQGPVLRVASAADQRLLRQRHPGEPAAHLRRAPGDRHCWPIRAAVLELRRQLRARHGDGPGAHRGPAHRHRRERSRLTWPAPSTATGADKATRFMQLCDAFDPAAPLPLRHPRHHGRAGGREDRAGAPRRAHVRDRRRA